MAILCTFLTVVFALYLVPLTISSPCIMEEKDLSPKPALIGHRGAPMVSASGAGGLPFKGAEVKTCLFVQRTLYRNGYNTGNIIIATTFSPF